MVICSAFFHMEYAVLLRARGALDDDQWRGLFYGLLPYLFVQPFEHVYRTHIEPMPNHHRVFREFLKQWFDEWWLDGAPRVTRGAGTSSKEVLQDPIRFKGFLDSVFLALDPRCRQFRRKQSARDALAT